MSRRIPGGGAGRGEAGAGAGGEAGGKRGLVGAQRRGKGEGGRAGLTGESRIDPTRLMLIRRMNRFPICFIISLLGNYTIITHIKEEIKIYQ